MIVADSEHILTLSGAGDVIEPDDGVTAVGSGGNAALGAARALIRNNPELTAAEIATQGLSIAAEIDIYTNSNLTVEELDNIGD